MNSSSTESGGAPENGAPLQTATGHKQPKSAARNWFERLVYLCNWLGSIWIFVMMLVVVADVLFRFFGKPINGPVEIIQASVVVVLYLQIAHTLKEGRITRSDAVYNLIRKHSPYIGFALGLFINIAGAALALIIVYVGWFKWIEAYQKGFFIGAYNVFTFPEWPIRFVLFFGCLLLFIQFLIKAYDEFAEISKRPEGQKARET